MQLTHQILPYLMITSIHYSNSLYIGELLKIKYVHITLAKKVQIQGGGPLPVCQSTNPARHNSLPSRDFAYIAPKSTFSGFKTL